MVWLLYIVRRVLMVGCTTESLREYFEVSQADQTWTLTHSSWHQKHDEEVRMRCEANARIGVPSLSLNSENMTVAKAQRQTAGRR